MHADYSVELGGDAPALEIPWESNDPDVRYYDLKNHPELIQQIPEAVAYPELASFLLRMNTPGFPMATAKCEAWASSELDPEEEIFGDRKFVSYVDLVFVDERERCSFAKHEAFAKELCRLLSHAPEIAAKVELIIRHCYYHQEKLMIVEALGSKAALSPDLAKTHDKQMQMQNDCLEESRQEKEALPLDSAEIQDKHIQLENECLSEKTHEKTALLRDPVETQGKQIQLEDHCSDENSPITEYPTAFCTGFCITAYVTGFGDAEHEPIHLWMISLNLLQHAIVQFTRPTA